MAAPQGAAFFAPGRVRFWYAWPLILFHKVEKSQNSVCEVAILKLVAIDPDPYELCALTENLRRLCDGVSVECFGDPLAAVKYIYDNRVDAVYTVLAMKRMTGWQVASVVLEKKPDIRFGFIGDGAADFTDEIRAAACACIVRPVTKAALARAVRHEAPGERTGVRRSAD